MQIITFSFAVDVPPARQDALLAEIRRWPTVQQALRLLPDAPDAELRRLCYAIPAPGQQLRDVVAQLLTLPEVETADPPAPRWLV